MRKLIKLNREDISDDLIRFIERVKRSDAKQTAWIESSRSPELETPIAPLTFYPPEINEDVKKVFKVLMYSDYKIPPNILSSKLDSMGYIPEMWFLFELHQEIWVDLYTAMGMPTDGAEGAWCTDHRTITDEMEKDNCPYYESLKVMAECEMVVIEITDFDDDDPFSPSRNF